MHTSDDELLVVDGVVEEVDAVPVLAEPAAATAPTTRHALPAMAQAAAVAATGFAAGAVTAAVVRAARSRRTVKGRKRPQQLAGREIVATRSFLVDVHVLAPRD